jgi:small GTP-binding protein
MKVLVLGTGGVGKTTFLNTANGQKTVKTVLLDDETVTLPFPYDPTETQKMVKVMMDGTEFDCIDTPGQLFGYKYTDDYDALIIVYDCNSKLSYKAVDEYLVKYAPTVPVAIVANKIDIKAKQVTPLESHYQVCSKTGTGIREVFQSFM